MLNNNQLQDVGIAVVVMSDSGPQTSINLANLDEIASLYLAIKGFTAFMTGFEDEDKGPGKIRGILQIPSTDKYAIAFDLNMKGIGIEEDSRLRKHRVGVICLIANPEQLKYIRIFYIETEQFLIENLKNVFSVAVLTEQFLQKMKKDYNLFLNKMISDSKQKQTQPVEPQSLYDVTILLTLPQEENKTARALMELAAKHPEGIPLNDLCELTKRKSYEELGVLENLIRKGLIIMTPHQSKKDELCFLVK